MVNKYDVGKIRAHIDHFKEKNAQRLDYRKVLNKCNCLLYLETEGRIFAKKS
jgi:ferredoxin-like protein FixX